ncbi:hypothetical protein C2W62_22270 [Candidatus Entotheonella serta]|nr:hypothetical protein C2W62_22270 [Candidatus Entotheonella serta]
MLEPVGLNTDEIYHILRKRLFAQLPAEAEVDVVADAYAQAVRDAKQMDITSASPEKFAQLLKALYPFHFAIRDLVVGWDNRSSSFWPRSSDHFDHFGKHQSGIYMPQGPEFIRCDYPNPLPAISMHDFAKIPAFNRRGVSSD